MRSGGSTWVRPLLLVAPPLAATAALAVEAAGIGSSSGRGRTKAEAHDDSDTVKAAAAAATSSGSRCRPWRVRLRPAMLLTWVSLDARACLPRWLTCGSSVVE